MLTIVLRIKKENDQFKETIFHISSENLKKL